MTEDHLKEKGGQGPAYQALARRYRPRFFRDFVGLDHVTHTLQNAIRQGRVGHAYLFCGPRGIGKTSMVRVFATALNCEKGPAEEPCGECDSCVRIHRGDDIDVIEIDGASHTGVDNVRELRSNAIYAPARSRYKIYVIDEVHMLSKPAFNALLKTLEEPPEHVKFLFATTEPQKVLETIQSRCQRFDFPRISARDIAEMLKRVCESEKIEASDKVLGYIARNVRGGMRDALSILDQVIAYCGNKVEEEAVYGVMGSVPEETLRQMGSFIAEGDVKSALQATDALFNAGKDPGEILDAFSNYLRDLLVLETCGADGGLLVTTAEADDAMRAQAARIPANALLYMLQILAETHGKLKFIQNQQVLLEVATVRLAQWEEFESFDEVLSVLSQGGTPHGKAPGTGGKEPPKAAATQTLPPQQAATEKKFDFAQSSAAETWNKAVDALFKKRGFLAAAVAQGQLLAFEGEQVVLGYAPEARFSMEQLQDPGKRKEAETALAEILGHGVTLKLQPLEAGPEAAPTPGKKDRTKRGRTASHMVKRALELFDGRIVD
ncbi:MAG: DNA polymerase III subunit gamma/tau [Planctomycetota bacterium]|nr:MAG: DNA polymerase III subunit gamma/tau [Planctomycetota bacterium]